MKFILIGHQKRQGKDTVARLLNEKLLNSTITSFADPLKEITAHMLGVSIETLDKMKNESEVFREYLKRLGNGPIKKYFGKNVWKKVLLEKLRDYGYSWVIVPDFRFPEEYTGKEADTITIKVHGRVLAEDKDASEISLNNFEFDEYILNDGSMEELEEKVSKLVEKINERFTN